jgi:hypothetical protein
MRCIGTCHFISVMFALTPALLCCSATLGDSDHRTGREAPVERRLVVQVKPDDVTVQVPYRYAKKEAQPSHREPWPTFEEKTSVETQGARDTFTEKLRDRYSIVAGQAAKPCPRLVVRIEKVNVSTGQGARKSGLSVNRRRVPKNSFTASAQVRVHYKLLDWNGTLHHQGRVRGVGKGSASQTLFLLIMSGVESAVIDAARPAVEEAILDAAGRLARVMSNSPEIAQLYRRYDEQHTKPADIEMEIAFDDEGSLLPNRAIDAGEDSSFEITVRNRGRGTAFDVAVTASSSDPHVEVAERTSVGDIGPGESRSVSLSVHSSLTARDDRAVFTFRCTESRGFDSRRVLARVETRRLRQAALVIEDVRVEDGSSGLARGNGNGVPEPGERVQLVVRVANQGEGSATEVSVVGEEINEGIAWRRSEAPLGTLAPGSAGRAVLAYEVPRVFSAGTLIARLQVREARGLFGVEHRVTRPFGNQATDLRLSARFLDSQGREMTELTNGAAFKVAFSVRNVGELEAQGVKLQISAPAGLDLLEEQIVFGDVAPSTETPPQQLRISVPRVFARDEIIVSTSLGQEDFPSRSGSYHMPVATRRPRLTLSVELLSRRGGRDIERNERANLALRVRNEGNLPAAGVRVMVRSPSPDLLLEGPSEIVVGRLVEGESSDAIRISLRALRRLALGPQVLEIVATQSDFSRKVEPYEVVVVGASDVQIVDVEAEPYTDRRHGVHPGVGGAVAVRMPPVIALAQPEPDQRTTSSSILVAGVVSDDTTVDFVELRVNGQKVLDTRARGLRVEESSASPRSRRFRFNDVPVDPGRNLVEVVAYDGDGLSATSSCFVHRESKRGEIYAVVVGISAYRDERLSLKYARKDGEAFARYLHDNLGVAAGNVVELYDGRASREAIMSALGTWLRSRAVNPEDTVFVYFAGHGAPERDVAAQDEDKIRKYLLAYETKVGALFSTAIPMDEIARVFQRIAAERIVFFLDSCYSGAGGGRTIFAENTRAVLSDGFLNRLAAGKGRIILASSRPNEVSAESDEIGHGYFTYYLLRGLQGEADANRDGVVDLDEITIFLNEVVPRETGGQQHPIRKGESEGAMMIGRVR